MPIAAFPHLAGICNSNKSSAHDTHGTTKTNRHYLACEVKQWLFGNNAGCKAHMDKIMPCWLEEGTHESRGYNPRLSSLYNECCMPQLQIHRASGDGVVTVMRLLHQLVSRAYLRLIISAGSVSLCHRHSLKLCESKKGLLVNCSLLSCAAPWLIGSVVKELKQSFGRTECAESIVEHCQDTQ
jgi:hypothetical protein